MKVALTAAVFGLAMTIQTQAAVLLSDDFNDNTLDAAKWTAYPATGDNVPATPPSQAVEANGRIEFQNRGYLRTTSEFRPADYAGPLRITGTWTFAGGDDFLQILTRSDGDPSGNAYGETRKGIEFIYRLMNDTADITGRGIGIENNSGSQSLDLSVGDTVAFQITDDGQNLSFQLTDLTGTGGSISITAQSSGDPTLNYIVFHNREGNRQSYLDDVTIAVIPEPAALSMLGLSCALLLRRRA